MLWTPDSILSLQAALFVGQFHDLLDSRGDIRMSLGQIVFLRDIVLQIVQFEPVISSAKAHSFPVAQAHGPLLFELPVKKLMLLLAARLTEPT